MILSLGLAHQKWVEVPQGGVEEEDLEEQEEDVGVEGFGGEDEYGFPIGQRRPYRLEKKVQQRWRYI